MGWTLACGPSGSHWRWVDDTPTVRPSEVEELRRRRITEAWLSQGQLAERIGMDVVAFSRAENGRASFTAAQLVAYRAALDAAGNRAAKAKEQRP